MKFSQDIDYIPLWGTTECRILQPRGRRNFWLPQYCTRYDTI